MTLPHRVEEPLVEIPFRQPVPAVAVAAVALGVLAAACAVAAGVGTREGLWNFVTGLAVLRWAARGALAASVVCAAALLARGVRRRPGGVLLPVVGLLLAVPAFAIPMRYGEIAKRVPAIHDITTDPQNPPQFVAVLPLRAGASNPAAYGGRAIAEQQRRAYPDIGPVVLPVPPPVAMERAVAAARRLGWTIVDADAASGRLEATDTTFWFGFKDDVVVRVGPSGDGSRIDVRSVSRVGKSDVGTNAARIRKFFAVL